METVIGIVNESTVVSAAECIRMVEALNIVLPCFCKDWRMPLARARIVPTAKECSPVSQAALLQSKGCTHVITINDVSPVDSALGFHDEENDMPYGLVSAKTVLDAGGAVLWGKDSTVSQCLGHEAVELLADVFANAWWQNPATGEFIAAETADPVQAGIVPVHLPDGGTVAMSDWIMPSWSDPQAKTGPFNHLNTLKAPFELQPGGYLIISTDGRVTQRFGEAVPAWVRAAKAVSHRHLRRGAKHHHHHHEDKHESAKAGAGGASA